MKTMYIMLLLALFPVAAGAQSEETMSQVIERGLQRAASQSLLMANSLKDRQGLLPRTYENGELKTDRYGNWVSGFFPGVLWMLYENSGDNQFRTYAELFTNRVEPAKKLTNTHDLGFMLYCSFGQGYRLTGNRHYLDVINEGTQSLLTRWNPKLGVIRSWDFGKQWQYPVIIDNMMNLEMLCFMTHQSGDPRYQKVAETHAKTTLKNHFRKDYSTFHVVSYDTITGKPHAKNTAQGYADGSAWARGQAWGLYGYTMMYRYTKNPAFLEQARKIAAFMIGHPRMPEDMIPYWDFDAPDIPNTARDVSAAAIMCSALIELSIYCPDEAKQYVKVAEKQLRTLSSPVYTAEIGTNGCYLLKHSTGNYPKSKEVDAPLSYADYYYIEALLRFRNVVLNKGTLQNES